MNGAAFTVSNAIALAGLLLTIAAMLLGVWWKIEQRIRGVEDDANEGLRSAEKDLADYKLHVTQEYASWNSVQQIESRLAQRIDAVSNKIVEMPDLVLDRISKYISLAHK